MDNLDRDIAMARKLGYGPHYGAYKVDNPSTRETEAAPVERIPQPDAICVVCGKPFEKQHGLQKLCSHRCREISNRRRAQSRYHRIKCQFPMILCQHCGTAFQPSHGSQKYCSRSCARRANNKRR